MKRLLPLFALAASLGFTATLTNGLAVYSTGTPPVSQNSTSPSVNFSPSGTTDHLFGNWWYYRVAGDTRESPFGTYTNAAGGTVSTLESSSGNTSTYTIQERDSSAALRFTAALAYTLAVGPGGSWADVRMSFFITNPTLNPLTISLFNYVDADVAGTPGGDSAFLSSPNSITISDAGTTLYHTARSPSAYQAGSFSSIRDNLLDNSVTNLNNTGLSYGPGDYTGAWQWDLVIAAGQTASIYSSIGTQAVPEPASFALGSLGIALLAALRKASRTRQ